MTTKREYYSGLIFRGFLVMFCFIFLMGGTANATTYFVRMDGNDTCSGLLNVSYATNKTDCAMRTITFALSNITAGQTVRVQKGLYNESITLSNSGNITDPITIIGDNNPILDGGNSKPYGVFITSKEYFTINGFVIRNYNKTGIYIRATSELCNITISNNIITNVLTGIRLAKMGGNYNNVIIYNNTIKNYTGNDAGATTAGIYADKVDNSTISYNIISDSTQGVGILWEGNYTILEHNNITNVANKGISTGNGYHSILKYNNIDYSQRAIRFDYNCFNNTISDNILSNSQDLLNLYPNTQAYVKNNTFNNGSLRLDGVVDSYYINNTFKENVDISIYGSSTYSSSNCSFEKNIFKNSKNIVIGTNVTNITIKNNIFENSSGNTGTIVISNLATQISNIIIKNNVFFNKSNKAIYFDQAINNVTIKNNIFSNITTAVQNVKGTNILVTYNLVHGNTSAAFIGANTVSDNLIAHDPLFAKISIGDFHLRSAYGRWDGNAWVYDSETSPAIGAGDPTSDNLLSPWGEVIEMGAYGNTPYASKSAPVTSPPDSTVSITPSSPQITPGAPFTLTIPITPATPIAGAQFDLLFTSSLATVTTVTEGNLFNQDGASTLFNSGTINNAAGTVINVYGSILGETTISSQGSMATINMTAGSTTGYLNLNLTNVVISDADSSAAPYTLTNATVLIDTAPELGSIGAKSVDEEDTLAFTLSASDADGDSLTYSASGLPTGASFNTATGAFSWTPADGQANTYVVTFGVTDGYLSDSEAVTITVNDGNHAPVISAFVPADGSVFNEVDIITIDVTASDADGQALTYNIKINGVTKSTTSSYAWETDYSSAGAHTINVIVSDGIEQVTSQHTITINNIHPCWDVDENGIVNILDITKICQEIGTTVEAPSPRWDVNQDGEVNVQDLTVTAYYFGETVA